MPKQYRPLSGRPLLSWSAQAFASHPDISTVQFVIGYEQAQDFERTVPLRFISQPPAMGGPTRQQSVRNGLASLRTLDPEFVLIHDAARPLTSRALIDRVIGGLRGGADAAIPLLPITDTLRRQEGENAWSAVSRDHLLRAQTPQGFRFRKIFDAHLSFAEHAVTDDMALAEIAGLCIASVAGEESNMKITTNEDFRLAESILSGGAEFRTGTGYDAHRFTQGESIWLCGVCLPHDRALEGHSDADVGLHALCDAILGAIAEGDIGQHFDPKEERWRGMSSSHFLTHVVELMHSVGGELVHCDVTLICEGPRIGPHREAMRARIAEIVGLERPRVSVKATSTDGLGFAGRREGIAAQAIATVRFQCR